jgi:hypothetical protein
MTDNVAVPERTDTLDAAVARLLKEPEQSAPLDEEPEPIVEPVELEDELDTETPEDNEETEGDDEVEDEVVEEVEDEEELAYYVVKVNGEELEVTLDELQSGYQRQKDYTQKSQALAEQRNTYDARSKELDNLQQTYMEQASLANELLNRDLKKFEKVDWDTMKVEDPVGYLQKQIEIQEVRQKQVDLKQQAQQVFEYNQRVQDQEAAQHLELQRKELLKIFPTWSESKVALAEQQKLVEYGLTQGYTHSQLSRVTDVADLVTLNKAMKYDAIQATKRGIPLKKTPPAIRKKVKAQGTPVKGGNAHKAVAEKEAQLRSSGSLKDAAALMLEMRSQKQIVKPRG